MEIAVEMEIRAIQQALQRLVTAIAAGDVDGYLAEWADDGVVMPPGQPMVRGRTAIGSKT